MKFNGLTYNSDEEQQDDCIKTYHYAVDKNGKQFILNISPYDDPTQKQFENACKELYSTNYDAMFGAPPSVESLKEGLFWVKVPQDTPVESLLILMDRLSICGLNLPNYDCYITMVDSELVHTGNINYAKNFIDKRFCNLEDLLK